MVSLLKMHTVHSFKGLRRIGAGAIAVLCSALPALAQRQPSQPGVPRSAESCGRADPTYIRVANATGGQPLFFKPSEVGRSSQFMRELSGSNHEILLWATETLDRSPQQFTVPVDSAIEKLTFTLSVNREGSTLTIVRPSGAAVRAGDNDVEITALACAQVMTVTTPEVGDWRVDIRGPGTFWFQAGAKTKLFLTGVEFVNDVVLLGIACASAVSASDQPFSEPVLPAVSSETRSVQVPFGFSPMNAPSASSGVSVATATPFAYAWSVTIPAFVS
jgi:hypothetical protein